MKVKMRELATIKKTWGFWFWAKDKETFSHAETCDDCKKTYIRKSYDDDGLYPELLAIALCAKCNGGTAI